MSYFHAWYEVRKCNASLHGECFTMSLCSCSQRMKRTGLRFYAFHVLK